MELLNDSWSGQREQLMEVVLECETPSSSFCEVCCVAEPVLSCTDCKSWGYCLCETCDDEVHSVQPFHNRKSFVAGFFKAFSPEKHMLTKGDAFMTKGFEFTLIENKLFLNKVFSLKCAHKFKLQKKSKL